MSEEKSKSDLNVCFICGAPHSGSTLLGLLLGSHSQCFYAGEANKVKFLNKNKNHPDRFCKICGPDCEIWGDFLYKKNTNLYNWLFKKTLKPIIIDSTKNLEWIEMQIKRLRKHRTEIYLIYLLRDGRAVINSRLRKYKNSEPIDLINEWVTHVENTNHFFQNFDGHKLKMHYEDLAIDPEKSITSACKFLKIDYEPPMLHYYTHNHHPLGGNTGTQSLIIKAQKPRLKNQFIHLSERNEYYYADHPLSIKLDFRWKEELDPEIQNLFEKHAGHINEDLKRDNNKTNV
ncbi:MAG: sulfotransferase family protein [Promethearchaeota archaeon]|nr:MAG: sulfotransferase family protein [Candidatus Lokiarchaeota archaeon]